MTTQPTHPQPLPLAVKLLNQASGSRTTEAAIILLTEAVQGQLLDAVTPAWEDDNMAEIDWATTRTQTNSLSGGERRLLALADSLATGHPVDLSDTLTGLDDRNSRAVVACIAHATGIPWGYDR